MESCKELRENNPYLFNSWRAILYTEKGRKAGMVINTKRHSELMNILDSSEWVNKEDYYDI